MVVVLDNEDTLQEAKVGLFADFGPLPSDMQYASIHFMAELATVKNPAVEIFFRPGTSPFHAPTVPTQDKQLAFTLESSIRTSLRE